MKNSNNKKGMKSMPLSEILVIIGSVVIALLLVMWGINTWRTSKSTGDKVQGEISNLGVMINEEQFTDIEGKNVSGNEVVSDIRSWKNNALCVKVVTKTQASGTYYNFKNYNTSTGLQSNQKRTTQENSTLLSDATNSLKPNYIYPNGLFLTEIVRNNKHTIIAVVFSQQ